MADYYSVSKDMYKILKMSKETVQNSKWQAGSSKEKWNSTEGQNYTGTEDAEYT